MDGFDDAKVFEKLPHINPGNYLLEVEALKITPSRNKGPMFIAEFKVIEADGPGANPPGTQCSDVIKMSMDSALGNIKGLVAALINEPSTAISQAMAEKLIAPENPAKGEKVRLEAFLTKTKAGADFTAKKYSPAAKVS